MAALVRPPLRGGRLLNHVLDSPALVQGVRALPAPALAALVDEVGLEDAGELVALASRAQLEQLFDDDLWATAHRDAAEESFDIDRFVLWLCVMAESGDGFVAEKLADLPEDLLTLAVQRSAWVFDMSQVEQLALPEDELDLADKALDSMPHETYQELVLVARDVRHWDAVWHALLCLDEAHHDLVERVLERCAFMTLSRLQEGDSLRELLDEEAILESDVGDARDERRAEQGYVSTADARAFLAFAKLPDVGSKERDPVTRAYFRRLSPSPLGATPPPRSKSETSSSADGLLALLRHAGALAAPTRGLLPGADAPPSSLRVQLRALSRTNPSRHAAWLDELAYLANVLLARARQASPLRPAEALESAVMLCEWGLRQGTNADLEGSTGDQAFLRGLRNLDQPGSPAADLPAWLLEDAATEAEDDG